MSLEQYINPTIVAAILAPALICIGIMFLYMLKYWKDKRKEEPLRSPAPNPNVTHHFLDTDQDIEEGE